MQGSNTRATEVFCRPVELSPSTGCNTTRSKSKSLRQFLPIELGNQGLENIVIMNCLYLVILYAFIERVDGLEKNVYFIWVVVVVPVVLRLDC